MNKILIIKLGALGDVVRTTPLLRRLKGKITWITQPNAFSLLQENHLIDRILDVKTDLSFLNKEYFHLVLNLEEDKTVCRLVNKLKKGELIGTYEANSKITYTDSSKEWFDMSLISHLGMKSADDEKWLNRFSYQEILFNMLGLKFKDEEYILPSCVKEIKNESFNKIVGLEFRSGERWVAKRWPRGNELIKILKKHNIPFNKFHQYPTLDEFMTAINMTDCVITTDSLALHIALGLKKKVIAIFTCTNPHEIYSYGRTIKIISPFLEEYFFTTKKTLKSGKAISAETVFKSLWKIYNTK